nr:hypothetical protein [Alphaproteobacteria bacterium]
MTRKKRPHYQPPPDTVIDLVKKADIDGVKAWVKEHPDQINDANLRDGEKYFTGTLLHAAYSACVKFQPVVGAINAVKLHQFLLQ